MTFENWIRRYQPGFHTVIPFNHREDRLCRMDFTSDNPALTEEVISDVEKFSAYISHQLQAGNYTYGIGGYAEHRTVYSRSALFDDNLNVAGNKAPVNIEPRRLHLGIDIWGPAGTSVYAFAGGAVHSFAFNNHYGDYGATLILQHQLEDFGFYSLYGHLALADIETIRVGQPIIKGTVIAHFGQPEENGHWPPHLHFQLIKDLDQNKGDYPGVCRYSERVAYLANCPDPDLVLQMMQYARD